MNRINKLFQEKELHKIIERLLKLPKECEWVEFKLNLKSENEIGKYISALSNCENKSGYNKRYPNPFVSHFVYYFI
jgi:hypothetical protein